MSDGKPCEVCQRPIGPTRKRTCGPPCRAELDRARAVEAVRSGWRAKAHREIDELLARQAKPGGAR